MKIIAFRDRVSKGVEAGRGYKSGRSRTWWVLALFWVFYLIQVFLALCGLNMSSFPHTKDGKVSGLTRRKLMIGSVIFGLQGVLEAGQTNRVHSYLRRFKWPAYKFNWSITKKTGKDRRLRIKALKWSLVPLDGPFYLVFHLVFFFLLVNLLPFFLISLCFPPTSRLLWSSSTRPITYVIYMYT